MFGRKCEPVRSLEEFLQEKGIAIVPVSEEQIALDTVQDFLDTRMDRNCRVREIYRILKHKGFQDIEHLYTHCMAENYLSDWNIGTGKFCQAKSALESLLKLSLDYNFTDYYNEQFQTAWRSVSGCLLDLQRRFSVAESIFRKEVWDDCQKVWYQWQEVKGNGNRTKKI